MSPYMLLGAGIVIGILISALVVLGSDDPRDPRGGI